MSRGGWLFESPKNTYSSAGAVTIVKSDLGIYDRDGNFPEKDFR